MIFGGDDLRVNMILAPFYFLFQTIIVPYTHLLNEERTKKLLLRAGWFIAMRSVLKWNQNTVDPQPANNIEMGSLNNSGSSRKAQNKVGIGASNGSGSNTNPRGATLQSINEACPEIIPNRPEFNISRPQSYCSNPTALSTEIRRTRSKVLPPVTRKSDSLSSNSEMHRIQEENQTGGNEELVQREDRPSSNPDLSLSSKRHINQLSSLHTTDSIRNTESAMEDVLPVVNSTKISHRNPHSNVDSCSLDLNIGNSGTSESLRDELNCALERIVGVTLVAEALPANNAINIVSYEDNEFKTFCRKELITKLIDLHYSSEVKYLQLFRRLLTLENELYMTETVSHDNDLFIAFLNKWLLRKKKKQSTKNELAAQDYKVNEHPSVKHSSQPFEKNQKDIARQDILHKMLSNVCDKWQYLKFLTNLYDVERDDSMTFDECVFLNAYL